MDYLVYKTQEEALSEENLIFSRGARIAALNGYVVDEEGINGQTPDGNPSTAKTTCWDVPRQRIDGYWVVLHPRYNDAARNPDWLKFVVGDLKGKVEEEVPSWWPINPEP